MYDKIIKTKNKITKFMQLLMKELVILLVVLLGSNCLYSQIAKVMFADGTVGYAVNMKRSGPSVGDTISLESLDQKVWQPASFKDSTLIVKTGKIQKIVFYKTDYQYTYAKVDFVAGKGDAVDDWAILLFNIGDTIQVVKKVDSEGEDIYKIYFGQLPGQPVEKPQLAIITKIKTQK